MNYLKLAAKIWLCTQILGFILVGVFAVLFLGPLFLVAIGGLLK
jgi:hypothetical protein